MLMVAFTVALGASLATAMLNVMLDVGDKVNQELKTYGANINVIPKEASLLDELYGVEENRDTSAKYLLESEIGNIKTIFWAFNIVDFTPYFDLPAKLNGAEDVKLVGTWFTHHMDLPTGEALDTGMVNMKNWWTAEGEWLDDNDAESVMVGSAAARKNGIGVGDKITLTLPSGSKQFAVKGIFTSGSGEDSQIYAALSVVQALAGKEGFVKRIEVSALTTPDNELSRRAAQNPKSLNTKEWETWYCTAYVSAICYQIDEVIEGSVSNPIRQVAESEGAILEKTQLLMLLITILSLAGSALGISNLVTAGVMERSKELGLLKAIGGGNMSISSLALTEIILTGIAGGIAAYDAAECSISASSAGLEELREMIEANTDGASNGSIIAEFFGEAIFIGILGQLHKEGSTIVVITHDTEVAAVAERTVVLEHGQIARIIKN
jgi:putative ABC transport system permease protein